MAAEECNTGLCLGLGGGAYAAAARHERPKGSNNNNNNKDHAAARACTDLSFTLHPKDEDDAGNVGHKLIIGSSLMMGEDDDHGRFGHKSYEPNNDYNNISCRKKFRFTKEQSSFLQDSFKLHTTLDSSQKQALAEQLNLKPRQVEVWFQNKRTRMKFKQTEVDCEFFKKCCESLSEENKKLKKELQELQSIKAGASPLFIQIQKATCSSCKKIITSIEGKKCGLVDVVLEDN